MNRRGGRKNKKRWILIGTLMAAIMATAGFAMGDTPGLLSGKTSAQSGSNALGQSEPVQKNASVNGALGEDVGDFNIEGGIQGTDYTYSNGVLTIKSSTPMTISNKNGVETTSNRIEVASEANLTLAGVNIETNSGPALEVNNSNVTITLADGTTNTLTSTGSGYAGLQKNGNASTGKLTIQGGNKGTGSLMATGGGGGAGIGGKWFESGSNITISGGTVEAIGGYGGAGIGGGEGQSGRNIAISGGTVTAQGGALAAGIGGGDYGSGSYITISGGTVTVNGGITGTFGGAGIGGGSGGKASNNKLEGNAVVVATSGSRIKEELEGFTEESGGSLKQGIVFTWLDTAGKWTGKMYGDVAIGTNAVFPGNLTIAEGQTLSVNTGVILTIQNGEILYNAGTLNADAKGYGTIDCSGERSEVQALVKYNPDGGTGAPNNRYVVYKVNNNQQKYVVWDLPELTKTGWSFVGWYADADKTKGPVTTDTLVSLNEHTLYAKWVEFPFEVTGGTKHIDWECDSASGILKILRADNVLTIKNIDTNQSTNKRIEISEGIKEGQTVQLTLAGVNIETNSGPALKIADDAAYNVTITLKDGTTNILDASQSDQAAGLQKSGNPAFAKNLGLLTIQDENEGTGSLVAIGGTDGAGIGGGSCTAGSNITISGGTVTATGGRLAAGIGGGCGGDGFNNSLNCDAVVFATSDVREAMEGFTYTKGIAFTRKSSSGAWTGTMYSDVTLQADVSFPASLTIPEEQALTVNKGVTLTIPDNVTLKDEGVLTNNGSITCEGTGQVTTLLKYNVEGGDSLTPSSKECVYLNSTSEDKTYGDLPTPTKAGCIFTGWYDIATNGHEITKDTKITNVNLHDIYAQWKEDAGPFKVTGGTQEAGDWKYDKKTGVLTINTTHVTEIANEDPGTPTDKRIEIGNMGDSTSTLKLTLCGVNINTSTGPALKIADDAAYNVTITLADGTANTLDASGVKYSAGLQKNGDPTTTPSLGKLTIQGGSRGTGSLVVTGGQFGAGIGSVWNRWNQSVGNITISGGTVKVTGGEKAAGIGGGEGQSGRNIEISGGTVTATGGRFAAGIGGGYGRSGSNITISGGTVKVTGGSGEYTWLGHKGGGAGIGGGYGGSGSNITISGGQAEATGRDGGAGIGGGGGESIASSYPTLGGIGSNINITGGTVVATGSLLTPLNIFYTKQGGAGIGNGARCKKDAKNNKLEGNAVLVATSGWKKNEALGGFSLKQGIAFTRKGPSDSWSKNMYGDVAMGADATFPTDFTISEGRTLTVNKGVTLTIPNGVTLRNKGTLTNNGSITCQDTGKVTTLLQYGGNGGTPDASSKEYTYLDSSMAAKTYGELATATRDGYDFAGWYDQAEGGAQILAGDKVNVNLHTVYAHWTAK